ncbi:uncharacterized protein LOC132728362, partial [Ruditapes philippinarum]|uniref:uncharacterized protein LOC132728362 n=1 Tax=Ruditapes philippinarum TaxID=129788 RepID=UPI00295C0DEB
MLVNGQWGTFDARFVDMYDARTICNTHNASLAMYFTSAIYGQGTGPILSKELYCNSEKSHISRCHGYSPYRSYSSHTYDLSIACTTCGLPTIYNGEPVSFNGNVLTIACHTGSQPNQVTMTCREDNNWFQEQRCTPYIEHPLQIEDIALHGGHRPTEGRVELKVNGTWGTICDTGFDSADAHVICNMFGLQYKSFFLKASHYSKLGSGPIYISNMACDGTESHINECSYEISNHCTHYDDVAVECTGYHLNITGVRLAGTNGPYHGRVEIKVNETWGTVCQSYFYSSEARFVCNLLGLTYKSHFYNAYYGQGSGPIHIDRLDCSSSYTSFDQCRYSIDNFYNCGHNSDVSVMCYGPVLNITDARLVNGTSVNDGRAEIKVNDTWGTICDTNFDIHAADLFCRLIGLRAAQYFTGAFYGEGSGPVFIDQLFCDNYDYTLSDCKYLFLNECSHARDISVVCNECGQPDIFFWGVDFFTYNDTSLFADCSYYKTYVGKLKLTCNNQTQEWVTEGECQEYNFPLDITDVRLVDGPNTTAGRVEIRSLDTWGTICDDAFGIKEAHVVCRMLGYAPAMRYFASSHFGAGKGPIFIDDLSCQEDAVHLNNCTYETYDNCDHDDDIAVVCTDCGDPTPGNGFTNSTETNYGAAVHVSCDKDYTLDGNSDIICQINGEWTNKPSCKLIDCGDPTPDNGKVNTTETTNGTVALISCDNGYTLSGQTVIACQSNGTWTQNPACDIVDCKVPKPNNAIVTLIGNKTTFGESASISCWTGYNPKVNSNVMCLSNGSWEKWTVCEIVDCGNPVPDKGSANSTNTTYNTVLEITCEPGYNLTGSSVIKCQENETWTDYPVCDTSDCGQFAVVNGEVNTSLGTSIGALATVKCDDGYDLQGSSEINCTKTGWNETVSCQIQECHDPSPNNGKITDTDGEDKFVFGNYVKIECNTGYSIEGDSVITCINGGNWSESTKCRLIVCEKHTVPLHGTMDDSAGNEYNSAVTFSCNEGYLLVGEKTSICGDDDKWSSEPPTCEKKSDVGGPCLSKEYCLMADSLCINSVCKCLTGIFDSKSKICDKMPLLPYGTAEGDHFISDTEVCGPDISFLPGMPVSGSMRKHLFVCSYGFVSFDNKYTNPTPPENRNGIVTNGEETIIAPFYGPIDKRTSGPVYFRSYDILHSYDKMKEDEELISYIENIVIKFGDRETFDASFVMIATWHEAMTTVAGFDSTQKSTFQAVLVSDGKSTYVFYIYGHGLMNWRPNDSEFASNVPIWVGHNVQNVDSGLSFTHPYSFTSQVLQLDSQPEVSSTEDDVAGLVFKPLHQLNMNHQNDAVDCINWYNDNFDNKKNLDYLASLMPECPCDIWLSRFDPWFWRIGLQRWRRDVNHICVNMLHAGNFRQYGKSCCYDVKTWLWVYERPFAGGFQLYHPRYPLQHILNDVIYKTKCCVNSNYCNLFYELRPTGSCYASSPYDFGTFWGDPHFITLDRKNFTFNGLGEYTLLHVDTDNFTLDIQARTERALQKNGKLSDATVFSAFAVKESSNASLHVELNKAKTGMIIYANKADITSQFYANTDPENPFVYIPEEPSGGGTLIISKRDDTLSVLFPTSGISLTISVSVEMLSLNTWVPKVLHGLTTGLLGNNDGNPENDFTMPNGTVLQGNLTEREVFEYGKTWSINSNDSVFIYEDGKSHFDFHNDSYIPRFLDEADPDKILEAEKACNGSQNIECIFDLVFTGTMEIAHQTSIIRGESDSTTAELEITVPTLSGCEDIYATKGQNVNCRINFDSDDEVYFLENNVDAKINISSSTVTYFQKSDDPVKIRIATKNKHGRSSPSFVLNIVLCTLCNGHGVCSNKAREDKFGVDNFKYAKCICEPEYQGDDCENDFDGCAANPCSLQRTCQSLTADEQKKQKRTYTCGPCPKGYKVDTENECKDVDECADNEDICDQVCTNTEGSFECMCRGGYKVDSENKSKCKDINECDVALHNCTHECVNNEGGFSCQCFTGFKFDSSTWTCIETSDEGSCTDSEKKACIGTSGCRKIDGKPECFCTVGYELDETKTICKDIDECNRGVCPHDCVNTNGSFECVCFTGYKLYGSTTCKACAVPFWGDNCANKCVCTGRGADRCDPIKGCICKHGWQGEKCDNDINECVATVDQCDDPLKTCVNSLGSYTCICRSGYQLTDDQKCKDIDECTDPQLNDCEQNCTNTVGSYSCKCRDGYTRLNGTSCTDVDECALGLDKCEQRCINNPAGFYSCLCYLGYSLNDDRRTCAKFSDQCLSINNMTCSHFCVLESEDASCACMKGFRLDPDEETCSDINECENDADNKCHINATCINTAGSYDCECPVGTQLENDGRTCSECDDYHYGKNCLHECSCLNGFCDKIKGCVCQHGWVGDNCDIDINECETGQIYCAAQNTMCVNLLGSATCLCQTGYENSTGKCLDIDECSDLQLNSCDQQCMNTNGSFTCSCHNGFQLKNGKCIDVNECTSRHGCGQICENTVGSYLCSCEEGFKLQLSDRKTCRPETECNEDQSKTCPAHASCYMDNGTVSCTCSKGFQPSGDSCEDVDECLSSVQPCDHLCNNTAGSFVCSCKTGFQLRDDNITCKECEAWKYGFDCQSDCSCDESNSERCDPATGTCVCKSGWEGINCEDDVDECLNDTACPTKSECLNSEGSYVCKCKTGYVKTGATRCEECDSRHFGEDCARECTCDIENTEDCNHETGSCTCNQGWQGQDCSEDVNECSSNSSICDFKAYSICRNNIGSYECICRDGFLEQSGICTDFNECLDNETNSCGQKCLNLPGSYECACFSGFHMSAGDCQDVDECKKNNTCDHNCNNTYGGFICSCEIGFYLNVTDRKSCVDCEKWTYGFECGHNCSCHVPNSERCDSKTGDCICAKEWNGSDCTEDVDECINEGICQENSYCENSYGSFDCLCDIGYQMTNGNICKECDNPYYGKNCSKVCDCVPLGTFECNHVNGSCTCRKGWTGVLCNVDIDECEENKTICEYKDNSTCNNENGSYKCLCNGGLRDEDDICTECDIWKFGANCESVCSCDTANTEYCNPETGLCTCKPGWNGNICKDDVNECETDNICPSNS